MRGQEKLRRIQIKLPNSIFVILLAAAIISGCGKQEPRKKFVARVNESYLTSGDLSSIASSGSYSRLYKDEFIRNWVRREVLYQAAQHEGILDDDEFKKLMENSKKELGAALMLKKFYAEESFFYEAKDVENFFDLNKNNFKLFFDSYLLNVISFRDEDKAVRFRLTAIETDWNKALNVFINDSSIVKEEDKVLIYEQDIHPLVLLRIVKELYPQEISIVLKDEAGNFSVVQLVNKYEKGTIPPFEAIKGDVEDKFLSQKKDSLLKDYLKELYSDYEIEIKTVGNK